MAQSQIEQTRISGAAAADPTVVELVRIAVTRAAELLDAVVPDHDVEITDDLRIGVELDLTKPDAADALARLIAIEALKSVDPEKPIPPAIDGWTGKGITQGTPPAKSAQPKAVLLDPSFSGGVRGKLNEAYRRKGGDAKLSRINDKIKNPQAGLVARKHLLSETKVEHLSLESDHVQIKVSTDNDTMVVRVYSEEPAPANGPLASDGAETGPVRFFPTLNQAGRLIGGKISVDRDLDKRDIVRALGNEVDLLAGLLKDGKLSQAQLLREMRAEMMQSGRTPNQPTAQDKASAAELEEVWRQFKISDAKKNLTGTPSDAEIQAERVRVLSAKLKAWGVLATDGFIGSKVDFLQQHLSKATLNELTRGLYFQAHPTSAFGSQDFSHLITPEDSTNVMSWVRGGHQEGALLRFAADHDELLLLPVKQRLIAGQTYKTFAQLRWKGSGKKPPAGHPDYPTISGSGLTFDSGKWQRSTDDKSTFEDLLGFVAQAETAWKNFLAGGGTPATGTGLWSAESDDKVPVKGYARLVSGKYEFASLFPDASRI